MFDKFNEIMESETSNLVELAAIAGLPKTAFRGADLTGIDLRNTDLSEWDLTGANLSGAIIDDTTILPGLFPIYL